MADIFRKTLKDREDREEGLKPSKPPASTGSVDPATGIDFFKPAAVDPEKEAARKAAKLKLLRGG